MRIVRIDKIAPGGAALEVHPRLTVLRGASPELRRRFLETLRAVAAGGTPAESGVIEVSGVQLALDATTIAQLRLEGAGDPVLTLSGHRLAPAAAPRPVAAPAAGSGRAGPVPLRRRPAAAGGGRQRRRGRSPGAAARGDQRPDRARAAHGRRPQRTGLLLDRRARSVSRSDRRARDASRLAARGLGARARPSSVPRSTSHPHSWQRCGHSWTASAGWSPRRRGHVRSARGLPRRWPRAQNRIPLPNAMQRSWTPLLPVCAS